MSSKKTERYAILPNGEKQRITGENGRYYICGDHQVRKASVTVEKAPKKEEQEKTQDE